VEIGFGAVLTSSRQVEAAELYRSGLNVQQTGDLLGVSLDAIY